MPGEESLTAPSLAWPGARDGAAAGPGAGGGLACAQAEHRKPGADHDNVMRRGQGNSAAYLLSSVVQRRGAAKRIAQQVGGAVALPSHHYVVMMSTRLAVLGLGAG